MPRASTNFPGLEEVLADLVEQKRKTAPSRRLPTPPTAVDIESNARRFPSPKGAKGGEGIFNIIPGSGGAFARKVLSGGMAAAPFALPAMGWAVDRGNEVNEWLGRGAATPEGLIKGDRGRRLARDKQTEQTFGGGLPSVEQIQNLSPGKVTPTVASSVLPPVSVQSQTPTDQNAVQVLPDMNELDEADLLEQNTAPQVRFVMPEQSTPQGQAQMTSEEVEILGDPDTIVQPDQNDLFAQQLEALAQMPPHTIERETVSPDDEAVVRDASSAMTLHPVVQPPKETFGRKVSRFVSSLSGDTYDPTRLDKLEMEKYLMQNALTEREKLAAGNASSNIRDTKQFNRAATMAEYGTGQIHPYAQFALDLLKGDRINLQQGQREATARRENFGYQSALQSSSAAASKLTPEMMQLKAAFDFFSNNPDANPQEFERLYGFPLNPTYVQAMLESRKRGESTAQAFLDALRDGTIAIPGSGRQAAKKPIDTSSIPAKKD